MSKCYYCNEVMKDENLKAHCRNVHNAAKRIAGERSVENWFGTPASAKVSKTSQRMVPYFIIQIISLKGQ